MRLRSGRLLAGLTVAASAALAPVAAGSSWAADTGGIHPGVMTYTNGAQCTANFIFTDGSNTYIGQAAHCSATGAATETDGCTAHSLPLGTEVEVDGASRPGKLAYSSWLTMQGAGERDPDTCAYNDIALVQLDPADAANVDPSIPFWGGPEGVASSNQGTGAAPSPCCTPPLRRGTAARPETTGSTRQDGGGGWPPALYPVPPGTPGASARPFLDSRGHAVGPLSTNGSAHV